VALTLINLLGPRWFLRINNALTIFKLMVPLLVIGLGVYAWFAHLPNDLTTVSCYGSTGSTSQTSQTSQTGSSFNVISVLTTVTAGGVIYSYLGFQGPLDFAGAVRRDGIKEAARLRRAVYGTVWGSILLYASLAGVAAYIRWRTRAALNPNCSPFAAFAKAVVPGWAGHDLSRLINLDSVLSPAGAALVFTYVLTREVAALSRAHLTHRGLHTSRYSVIAVPGGRLGLRRLFGERLDVYWLILIVDCSLSALALLVFRGNWNTLSALTSVLALVVYATPGVVLTALYHRSLIPRSRLYQVLARCAFIAIAVVLFLAGWDALWPSLATLTVCCLVLFALPVVFSGSRWYDAEAHAAKFRQWKQSPEAQSALVLYGFFAALALASLLNQYVWPTNQAAQLWSAVPIAGIAWPAFDRLVNLSVEYMRKESMKGNEPFLPRPLEKRQRSADAETRPLGHDH
jgi:amino acid transporter